MMSVKKLLPTIVAVFFLCLPALVFSEARDFLQINFAEDSDEALIAEKLSAAGIEGFFSASTAFVLLNEFDAIVKVPVSEYNERLLDGDPRKDSAYVDALHSFFVSDGTRRFFVPYTGNAAVTLRTVTQALSDCGFDYTVTGASSAAKQVSKKNLPALFSRKKAPAANVSTDTTVRATDTSPALSILSAVFLFAAAGLCFVLFAMKVGNRKFEFCAILPSLFLLLPTGQSCALLAAPLFFLFELWLPFFTEMYTQKELKGSMFRQVFVAGVKNKANLPLLLKTAAALAAYFFVML